jgi:hypothetical protein
MLLALVSTCSPETDREITTAELQPYPGRARTAPSSVSPGYGLPLFEKSNVLVMYTISLYRILWFASLIFT